MKVYMKLKKNLRFTIIISVIALLSMLFLSPLINQASAATNTPSTSSPCTLDTGGILGIPPWYKYLNGEQDLSRPDGCSPVIDSTEAALPIGIAILEAMLRLSGYVAVVFVIIGGVKYITSAGNPEKASEAKSTIINTFVGLIIIIVASGIVSYIGRSLSSSTATTNNSSSTPTPNGRINYHWQNRQNLTSNVRRGV